MTEHTSGAIVCSRGGPSDAAVVVRIEHAAFHESRRLASDAEAELALRAELAQPWARLWLGSLDGKIVGYAKAWHVHDELHVHDVATHARARRRGVGRALVGVLVAYARAERVAQVLLEVRASNMAAIELYRSAGFGVIRRRRSYYQDGEDGLEMRLLLDPATGDRRSDPDRE